MDTEKIKALRSKIAIPLSIAINLLKENDGDVDASVREFHRNNMNTICRLAECENEIAEEYYLRFHYDIQKAIEGINERPVCIFAKVPDKVMNKIGFVLWAKNSSLDKYKTSKNHSIFIPTDDFGLFIGEFRSALPLKHPYRDRTQETFDIYGYNYFDNMTCRQIIERIARMKSRDIYVEQYLRDVIKWFNDKLRYAECIVIYGNQ